MRIIRWYKAWAVVEFRTTLGQDVLHCRYKWLRDAVLEFPEAELSL